LRIEGSERPIMIRLTDVRKQFAGGATPALDGVSLTIAQGEVFGIIGRSGAGKSTLIRLLNGLERPTSGHVAIEGLAIDTLPAAELRRLRQRMGMIFQNFGLLSSRTVAGNVGFPLDLAGTPRRERDARVAELLDRVGLAALAGRYPAQLSGGQRQRVGIARALATGPAVLLCDEATSALDPETTRDVLALLRDLNRELGLTIVLITHEMEVVRSICDRVAVIEAGRIVETGTVEAVFAAARHPATQSMLAAVAA
jgi:D-methionine transport system ATP-binding protein